MKKAFAVVLYGFVLFSFRHVVKPTAQALKKTAHAVYKAAI